MIRGVHLERKISLLKYEGQLKSILVNNYQGQVATLAFKKQSEAKSDNRKTDVDAKTFEPRVDKATKDLQFFVKTIQEMKNHSWELEPEQFEARNKTYTNYFEKKLSIQRQQDLDHSNKLWMRNDTLKALQKVNPKYITEAKKLEANTEGLGRYIPKFDTPPIPNFNLSEVLQGSVTFKSSDEEEGSAQKQKKTEKKQSLDDLNLDEIDVDNLSAKDLNKLLSKASDMSEIQDNTDEKSKSSLASKYQRLYRNISYKLVKKDATKKKLQEKKKITDALPNY